MRMMRTGVTTHRAAATNWRKAIAMTTRPAHVAADEADSTATNLQIVVTAAMGAVAVAESVRSAGSGNHAVPAVKWQTGVMRGPDPSSGIAANGAAAMADASGPAANASAAADIVDLAAIGKASDRVAAMALPVKVSRAMALAAAVSSATVLRGPGIVAAISAIGVISGLPTVAAVIAALLGPALAVIVSSGQKAVMDGGAGITADTAGLAARFIAVLHIGVSRTGVPLTAVSPAGAALAGLIIATGDSAIDLLVTKISRDTTAGVSGLIDGWRSIAGMDRAARTCGPVLEGTKPVLEDLPAVSLEWDA